MEREYLKPNIINFITIAIMAYAGMAVVGFIASMIRTRGAATDAAS